LSSTARIISSTINKGNTSNAIHYQMGFTRQFVKGRRRSHTAFLLEKILEITYATKTAIICFGMRRIRLLGSSDPNFSLDNNQIRFTMRNTTTKAAHLLTLLIPDFIELVLLDTNIAANAGP
jgi:hypothetical protein